LAEDAAAAASVVARHLSLPEAGARRAEVVRRQRHLWDVVEQFDLPTPASVFVGEYSAVTEVFLCAPDPDADVLESFRWWVDALFPGPVLSAGRAEVSSGALEIAAVGALGGVGSHRVRVVQYLPGIGHLMGPPQAVTLPELSGLLCGWHSPPAAAPPPPPPPAPARTGDADAATLCGPYEDVLALDCPEHHEQPPLAAACGGEVVPAADVGEVLADPGPDVVAADGVASW